MPVSRLPVLLLPLFAACACAADGQPAPAPLPVAVAPPPTQDQLDRLTQRIAALEARQAGHQEGQLIFFGFADLTWQAEHGERGREDDNHFALGQFDLFVHRDLGERAGFLGEVVLEADEVGNTGVDLERCMLSYRPTDTLELGAGRYHTHLGWWNANYHHGEWFQPTIGRPAGLAFEDGGGILPVHLIGLTAEQQVALAPGKLVLIAEIGNGRGPTPDPPQVAADANNGKAVNLACSFSPTAFPDLEVGVDVLFDRIPAFAGSADFPAHASLDELIVGVHGVLQHGPLQANLEAFSVRHSDRQDGGATAISRTGYALVAWRFDGLPHGALTPFLRADLLQVDDDDTYFASTDDRTDLHLGVRWDLTSAVAVKLQGTASSVAYAHDGHDHSGGVAVQICGTY
jgi:hypothetical protein